MPEMERRQYYLAQLNVARMRAALDAPLMAGFLAQLEAIYQVAERAEGFVWRLRADDGTAAVVRPAGDARLIVTMSVWESIGALHAYVYRSEHSGPLRQRAEWFERADGPSLVLWWIPQAERPRVEQGLARLKYLKRHGPTAWAFTFKEWFPPPGESDRTSFSFDDTGSDE
jgi:uncharacterized protein DUF3291